MSAAQDIALKISDRLAAITIANGYATDIGLRVFRGRRRIDPDMVPCVVLIEGDDDVRSESLRSANIGQQYFIEGHDACDPDNPNDKGHEILADLKKAVFSGDTTFGRSIRKIDYKGRRIVPREEGITSVAASIHIEAQFVEDLTSP